MQPGAQYDHNRVFTYKLNTMGSKQVRFGMRESAGLGAEDICCQMDNWHAKVSGQRDLNWLARRAVLSDGLRDLCELAGIPYMSPHKLRHGHTVYMMRRVKDMKQLKSLSQNRMRSSVAITDGIYGAAGERRYREDV
jgi:hypothetical protein